MTKISSSSSVLWLQVFALAGVQGAITLTWVIYDFYLQDLLVAFGFAAPFAATLLIIENAIAAICEPIMGGLSESQYRWMASGLPFISLGVILSSALFIAIPAIAIWGNTPALKWFLPVILVAWTTAMTVFRAPALSLLKRYSKPASLPQAASIITFMGSFVGAWRSVARDFLLSLGPAVTFTVGSVVLLLATGLLRFFHPPQSPDSELEATESTIEPVSIPIFAIIALMGTAMAWTTRFLFGNLPGAIATQLPQMDIDRFMLGFGLFMAFTTLLAGQIGTRLGNEKAMTMGVVGVVLCLPLVATNSAMLLFVLALFGIAIAYPLIWNGVIPLALSTVPSHRAGLGIGCFFGGFTAGMTLFNLIILPQQGNLSVLTGAIAGAISCAAIGVLTIVLNREQSTY
ncbi:hypothetical protein [Roseofilum casamattae]|uniref:MFS transporter n=1 Tax=Roseofilum casamattae BLCC-M143 TaxID=3022442 RepID=A0ABT7BV52_9CYAN|nr:hypothetical protein [Roseofilum casamattae]MDJ1183061.1 hypothetical protein [Roseofilum casamattae BLCC-M143]